MAIWLFRAGKSGEYEKKFLEDKRIYLTWPDLNADLSKFTNRTQLFDFVKSNYNLEIPKTRNWTNQIWPMAHTIKRDDWIILPSKFKPLEM